MRPWLKKLWGSRAGRPQAAQSVRRHGPRLAVEQLEDRAVPASYTASTVPELIAAIEQANATSVEDTITLAPSQTFTLTKAISGVAANTSLIIVGNGDIIERSKQTHSAFRLFDVAAGASLTLTNLTLRGGIEDFGGAIYNVGTLSLDSVTLQNNFAYGFGGAIYNAGSLSLTSVTLQKNSAELGGAIYSTGTLTMQDCTVKYNTALGYSPDANTYPSETGAAGSSAAGGGLYIGGGTASLTNVQVSSNTAQGGNGANGGLRPDYWGGGGGTVVPGGDGGEGWGGGIYAEASTVTLRNCSVDHNSAVGGKGGTSPKGLPKSNNGEGLGGGLMVMDAVLYLDPFTVAHLLNNTADRYPNIYGTYTLISRHSSDSGLRGRHESRTAPAVERRHSAWAPAVSPGIAPGTGTLHPRPSPRRTSSCTRLHPGNATGRHGACDPRERT